MPSPLKIVFSVSCDYRAGTYFRYHNFAQGLIKRGHTVTVLSQNLDGNRRSREEIRDGVTYLLAPTFRGDQYMSPSQNPVNRLFRSVYSFRKRSAIHDADVFHLFQPFENASYPWLNQLRRAKRSRNPKRPAFIWDWDDLWAHGIYSLPATKSFLGKLHFNQVDHLEHVLPAAADAVTTCSRFLADHASERGAKNVRIIHNGFWPYEGTAKPDRIALRQRIKLDPEAFYLAFTGFTSSEFDWCLDLVEKLAESHPVRLACCGGGLDRFLNARGAKVTSKVDFLGLISSEETRLLLTAVDVGLLPQEKTPFNESRLPMKFAEYLAAGLPVLGSDVGEIGRLARELSGVNLLGSERKVWVEKGCEAVIEIMKSPAQKTDHNSGKLRTLLGWPGLTESLEALYYETREVTGRLKTNGSDPILTPFSRTSCHSRIDLNCKLG